GLTAATQMITPDYFGSLAVGADHTCGLTGAGAAYCWGRNSNGQLGDNTTTNRSTPVAVLGVGGGTALTFASLTAGYQHTCGLTSASAAYCWGLNSSGQLGDNQTAARTYPHPGDPNVLTANFGALSVRLLDGSGSPLVGSQVTFTVGSKPSGMASPPVSSCRPRTPRKPLLNNSLQSDLDF
ncbi:MAG: hypothetical protein NTU67_05025, partial [Gemmatimonadetes bacterium]|nr:hypothetical protein [Gemmatimonadota bacterium]